MTTVSLERLSLWPRPIRRERVGHTFILGAAVPVVKEVVKDNQADAGK
jgi:hypothetical protein